MNGTTSDTTDFLSPASFWIPDHMPASAWIEHGSLAFWLTETLAPRRFVELGVGRGYSYFCFCQAIDRLGLATEAFGVDSWTERDGIHDEVAALNRRYSTFSTLIRATFDVAKTDFASPSIDLLHIDGAWDYDSAAAAFDGWRPLLTGDAVVLLHGVSARDGSAGVYRLFEELRARYPSLQFPFGQGLGLVAPGGVLPEALRRLLADRQAFGDRVVKTYGSLGRGLRARRQLLANRHGLSLLLQPPTATADEATDDATDGDVEVVRLRVKLVDDATRHAQALDDLRRQASLREGRSDELNRLEGRLAALEALVSGVGSAPTAPRGIPPAAGMQSDLDSGRMADGASPADLERLQAKLRDARSSEAAAHRFARAARRAILARHGELGRQALDLESAAAAARAEVIRLADNAQKLIDSEFAADQARERAQHRLNDLLRHEQTMLEPRRDLKHILSLGAARRWRRQARTYAALVAKMDAAAAAIHEAQQRYEAAKEDRRQGEQLALAAEPRASELASAAVVLRGEFAAAEEILSALPADPGGDAAPWGDDYSRWVDLYDTITDGDRRAIRARLLRLSYKPLISIVMPVYETPLAFLRQAVASVQAQLYPNWELCIADDASPNPAVGDMLAALAAAEPRVKIVRRDSNGHISAASNSALALATGEFVALMDHDDILPEQALFEVVACLNEDRDLDLIYSDEDHIDQHGTRSNPYFKPEYNHDLMLGHNLINHFGVYRRALVEAVGGFRVGFEGSQDYDLALRVIDASTPERIRHIPAVLYHWRSGSGEATFSESAMQRCIQSARQALADHLTRRDQAGDVVTHPSVPMWLRIRRARPEPAPLVSVIIPTKNKAEILRPCVEGVLQRTDYPNLEIIIVDHQSTEPATLRLLAELSDDPRVRVLAYEGEFNYSAINNAAVAQAKGTVLALLNNDVDVINSDWLDEMVSLAVLPDVGAVGAKLLYPDNRVQHAGVILGPGGVAGHLFHLLDAHAVGYFGRAVMTSTVAAVTAACLVIRKSVFEEAGGFDQDNLAVAFNDVDLCLKIRHGGYRNVWTPQATLYHHESISRGSDEAGERLDRFNREIEFMMQKWGRVLNADPFYNPNLNLTTADFSLSFPPRRRKPWRVADALA